MKVGDYVRTRQGNIFKWEKYMTTVKDNCREVDSPYIYINQNDIIKSSPNIIDLIEVGDFVNGMQVTRICFDEDGERILNLSNCILELMNDDIKSIITKEQFESMEYRIGD